MQDIKVGAERECTEGRREGMDRNIPVSWVISDFLPFTDKAAVVFWLPTTHV